MPTTDDLAAEGLAPDEVVAVLTILDTVLEGAGEPQDESVDVGQGVPLGA
jgi:hypothetical protein